MTKQLSNTKLINEGVRNLLNLLKSTTKDKEVFADEFRSLLVNIREEYDSIKSKPYNANQTELAVSQLETVNRILNELDYKPTTQSKKKTVTKRSTKAEETNVFDETVKVDDKVIIRDNNGEIVLEANSYGTTFVKGELKDANEESPNE